MSKKMESELIDWKYFPGEEVILGDGRRGIIGTIYAKDGVPLYDVELSWDFLKSVEEKDIKGKI